MFNVNFEAMYLRTEIENIVHEILMEGVTKEDAVEELLNLHSVSISLLKKYMSHVMDNESVSFVENANDSWSNVKFTDNELEILKSIHKEITNEY